MGTEEVLAIPGDPALGQALLALTCSHLATPHCAIGAELHPAEPLPQRKAGRSANTSQAVTDSQVRLGNGLRIIGLTPDTALVSGKNAAPAS